MVYRILPLALALGALAGCGSADDPAAPGAPSASEQRALDEAAQMIEEERLPAGAIPPTTAASAAAQPSA